MENKTHRLIVVSYELYSLKDGNENFIEKTNDMQPMQLFTGCEEQAYGERDDKSILSLDKATFSPNGVFDSENIYKDAVVPLQNEEGQRFLGKVLEVSDDKVTIDLNHPLAGMDLVFHGHVFENREASEEEVKDFFEQMNQHHCGGGCGGGCGSNNEGGCGCGGHEDGEGGCCGCH